MVISYFQRVKTWRYILFRKGKAIKKRTLSLAMSSPTHTTRYFIGIAKHQVNNVINKWDIPKSA